MFPTINLFGISVPSYYLFMLIGFISVLTTALFLITKEVPARYVFWIGIIMYIFAVIGALILSVVSNIISHQGLHLEKAVMTSGLAYLGAPIFGLGAVWIYCRIMKFSFLFVADYLAPLLMLERAFGRLGCLFSGCCYGVEANLPWAYPFIYGRPGHPTQAYEMAITLAVLVSSVYLYRKTTYIGRVKSSAYPAKMGIEEVRRITQEAPSQGIILYYVLLAYSSLRSFNDLFRAEGPFLYGPIKAGHLILFTFMLISLIGLFGIIKRSSNKDELLKALWGTVARLFVWLIAWLIIILYPITIYNRTHILTTKYKPKLGISIPKVKIPVGVMKH